MPDRPLRADAKLNYERLVRAASDAFNEAGVVAPFEEIARRAGVGSATMHRRFPSRTELFEAVYSDQVARLLEPGPLLGDAWDALESWLRRFVDFIATKRAFGEEMAHDTALVLEARRRIYAIAEPLVARTQEAGQMQAGLSADDVLRMLSGIGVADYPQPGQRERVIAVCLRGLRA